MKYFFYFLKILSTMQRLEREAKNCASASFCASYENGWVGKKRWQGDGAKGLCPLQGKHLT
jgi:hypothetical protein